jgi:hypothetical protein
MKTGGAEKENSGKPLSVPNQASKGGNMPQWKSVDTEEFDEHHTSCGNKSFKKTVKMT